MHFDQGSLKEQKINEVENNLPEDNNPLISQMRKLNLTKVK